MIRRPPRSTRVRSSAASDVYKRQVAGVVGHVRGDLVDHAYQGGGVAHRGTSPSCRGACSWSDSSPAGACEVGITWTAVTLYSGQLVAQSELSVVTMFAPLAG